jgi:hypothetical protein
MDVLSPAQAYRLFGERGRHGVVAIMTKAYIAGHGQLPPTPDAHVNTNPIFIVDSVHLPDGPRWTSLINPDSIYSVNILKNSAAAARYGPQASTRGVVIITTRPATKQP